MDGFLVRPLLAIIPLIRNTPRAQTSATPSLKRVKQSTQAWNGVAYCLLCRYPENFMNVHPSGIPWCCPQTRTQKIKKEPYAQRVKPIIPKMIQISSCVIANISWKFHDNSLIDFTVVLLTNTPGAPRWETVKQSRQVWNSIANYFLCRAWHFIKISWKFSHLFFSIIIQTNTDPKNR